MKKKKEKLEKTYAVRFYPSDIRALEFLATYEKVKPTQLIRELVTVYLRNAIKKPKYQKSV
jgi:hypothetical protein